jgi:glycosyltransferase involved in cell wall biosynthesis
MNKFPLVSIIIPTYNRAHLIGVTLESIKVQTYTNWECIVIDDGSNDNTFDLLEEYCKKDNRFHFYQRPQERLQGGNAARNFGYEQSRGEYVQWFDSDDLMHPRKIELKIENALKYKADIVIDKNQTNSDFVTIEDYTVSCFLSSDFYIDFILGKKNLITDDILVKRNVINKIRFDEKVRKAQEYEFFSRLFQQKLNYCFIDIALSFYRTTENSISTAASKGNVIQTRSLIYIAKVMMERHNNDIPIVEYQKRQGRKLYKSLALRRNIAMIINDFHFFKKCHYRSSLIFVFFIFYNTLFGRGFDLIKREHK